MLKLKYIILLPLIILCCTGCKYIKEFTSQGLLYQSDLNINDTGYAVEFFFDKSISNVQVNDSTGVHPNITSVSDTHWIISKAKLPKMNVKRAAFNLKFTMTGNATIPPGVILNGKFTLCGEGKTAIISSETHKNSKEYNRACNSYVMQRFEHETTMLINADPHLSRIGLAVDVIFDTFLDKLSEVVDFQATKVDERHYSFLNSGYVTNPGDKVKLQFTIFHRSRPPPKVNAVIMNNFVICGFAASVIAYNDSNIESLVPTLEEADKILVDEKSLILVSMIISVCWFCVTVVAGIFTWSIARTIIRNEC